MKMSLRNKNLETKGLRAVFILEIIGRPAEHLTETLNKIIDQIDEEKGIKVIEKKVKEVIEMKDKKDFYTTFAEVEVEAEEVSQIVMLMFKYMPANVEIIEPELIALSNNGWSDILSELTRRLHGYDEIARVLQLQNAQMQKKLKELGVEIKPQSPPPKEQKEESPKKEVSKEVKETLEETKEEIKEKE